MTASLRGLPACNTEACGLSRLKNHSALLVRFAPCGQHLPHKAGITPRYCSSNFAIETAIERRLACDHQDDAHHLRLHREAHMVEAGWWPR